MKGIYHSNGKWRVYISLNGKTQYLGTFADYAEAVKMREWAERSKKNCINNCERFYEDDD